MTKQMAITGSPAQGEYSGPGWAEWLLGFLCTVMAATQLRSIFESPAQQTALSYYFQEPLVRGFHISGMVVDALVVLVVLVWIFVSQKAEVWGFLVMALCLGGFLLSWAEAIRAVTPDPTRVYRLEGLPFYPLNNLGLFGASVFFGYYAMKLPVGEVGRFAKVMLRGTVWVGLFGVQWMIFEQMVSRWQ